MTRKTFTGQKKLDLEAREKLSEERARNETHIMVYERREKKIEELLEKIEKHAEKKAPSSKKIKKPRFKPNNTLHFTDKFSKDQLELENYFGTKGCNIPSKNSDESEIKKGLEIGLEFMQKQLSALKLKQKDFEKNAENFIFVGDKEKEFSEALQGGELQKLVVMREKFPIEYRNEIELQKNFNQELKKGFKEAFLSALQRNDLKNFAEYTIGAKIVGQFPKYKNENGEINYESFSEDIKNLKDKDSLLDYIVDIFHKITSFFGFEKEKRNNSKEKFYSNIIEAVENISSPSPSISKSRGESIEK